VIEKKPSTRVRSIPLVPLISIFVAIALSRLGEALYQAGVGKRCGQRWREIA
jgi:hypothetical protein